MSLSWIPTTPASSNGDQYICTSISGNTKHIPLFSYPIGHESNRVRPEKVQTQGRHPNCHSKRELVCQKGLRWGMLGKMPIILLDPAQIKPEISGQHSSVCLVFNTASRQHIFCPINYLLIYGFFIITSYKPCIRYCYFWHY